MFFSSIGYIRHAPISAYLHAKKSAADAYTFLINLVENRPRVFAHRKCNFAHTAHVSLLTGLDNDTEEWENTPEETSEPPADDEDDTILRKDGSPPTETKEEMRKPRKRGCGTTARTKTRLAGGQPADPKEWPWMVALLRRNSIQYCGGVLITDRHVLTAAHCVYR